MTPIGNDCPRTAFVSLVPNTKPGNNICSRSFVVTSRRSFCRCSTTEHTEVFCPLLGISMLTLYAKYISKRSKNVIMSHIRGHSTVIHVTDYSSVNHTLLYYFLLTLQKQEEAHKSYSRTKKNKTNIANLQRTKQR
jgi:hypothetical protein